MKSILKLKDVWKIYKMGEIDVPALKEINLEINEGEFVAIIGSSGSGKSTIMNLIGCLDTPTKGTIHLKNQNINILSESNLAKLRGKTIGFIFQQYNLIHSMTAYENVILPLELLEVNENEAQEKTIKIIRQLGLKDKFDYKPSQLSGGQQQRVSIARCLVTNPDIILADEPTGALDTRTGKEVLEILQKLWKENNKTVIMVTHDLNLASFAKRHIELRDGRIIKDYNNKKQKNNLRC
jgi:putative ABC transport system ATP-binding protein